MDKLHSYTAASTLPIKLFRNSDLALGLERGVIPPIHVQWIPTNKCNLNCSFCSCANRTRSEEMPIQETIEMIDFLASKGTKAVTITGGGEPILYKDFGIAVEAFYYYGIKMGLVSNGELLHRVNPEILRKLTWCRISAADERPIPINLQEVIDEVPIDWAFSYVLSDKPNINNIKHHVKFAEKNDFTHVRIVSDLLNIADIDMEIAQKEIHSDLVIWQGRKEWTQGDPNCRISLLKPLIGPDGLIYPCCGVQYAHEEPALDLPKSMSMGHWSTIGEVMFNGSKCVKCYYHDYNNVLAQMDSDIQHLDFV